MGTIAATVLLEAVGALREPVDFTPVSRKVAPELIVRGSTAVQRITKL